MRRRLVLSFAAILSAAALGACSGGGSVLSFDRNSTPDHVIITVQEPSNIARVLPGAGLPLSAVAVRGSQNGILNINTFRWSAALTTGLQYPFNTFGQTKPCANVNITSGGVTQPYLADFGIYIAIDPTNEGNIEFIPPTIIPAPFAGSTIQTNYTYCVIVNAQGGNITGTGLGTTFNPIGQPGSILVQVANPSNPLASVVRVVK
jgi:hypothetical protein